MDNQHRKITGYRELSQPEIDLMNEVKAKVAAVGELIQRINTLNAELATNGDEKTKEAVQQSDCFRWASIAKTDLQTGAMALTRAVAKPTFF